MYTTTEVIVWQPYNHVHVYMLLYKLLRPTKKSVIHLTFASCNVLHNKPSLTDSSILETFILQTLTCSFIPEEPEFFFHFKFFIEICNLSDYNMETLPVHVCPKEVRLLMSHSKFSINYNDKEIFCTVQ